MVQNCQLFSFSWRWNIEMNFVFVCLLFIYFFEFLSHPIPTMIPLSAKLPVLRAVEIWELWGPDANAAADLG